MIKATPCTSERIYSAPQIFNSSFVYKLMSDRIPNSNRSRLLKWFFIFAVCHLPASAMAQDAVAVPDAVKRFVDKEMIPIALETGDLNADGREDLILVISGV